MNTFPSIALLSLFLPWKLALGGVIVRPFDGLVAVFFAWVLLNWRAVARRLTLTPLLILLPFFSWHVISAFTYSLENGLRELIQVLTILAFLFSACAALPLLNWTTVGRYLIWGMAAVTAYNIYYHVSLGFLTGWKRLLDPKATFNFLPPLLGTIILYAQRSARPLLWGAWWGVGALVLLSGDRKSLLAFLIFCAVLLARGRIAAATPVLGAATVLVFGIVSFSGNAYLANQLYSMLDPVDARNTYEMIARGQSPTSPSNAQRLFAFNASRQMLEGHLLFGIGTNAYENRILAQFAYLPRYLRIGIHGEFLRVLVENGAVGLSLYLVAIGAGLRRFWKTIGALIAMGRIQPNHRLPLATLLLLAPLFYITFEASGTHAFIVLAMIIMSADILYWSHMPQEAPRGIPSIRPLAAQSAGRVA